MTPTLTLAMIVKNEERTLGRVLAAAAQFCDELVVVDTGSTDRTMEIAKEHSARVKRFDWCDDFAAARNYSFDCCNSDWILWLDADDVLPDTTIEIGKRIKNELLGKTDASVVRCPYEYSYNETDGKPSLIHGRERFVRRSAGIRWTGMVHEVLNLAKFAPNEVTWITCPEFVVEHRTAPENVSRKTGRNLRIYGQSLDTTKCDTRDLYLYASELRGAERYAEAVEMLKLHLARWPKTERDLFEEPYIVRMDLAECCRRLGDLDAALKACAEAIYYNGTRAEGYGLMGVIHFELGNYAAAFPSFLAAAACKAPQHGGVVYTSFYSEHIHEMIKESKRLAEK